MDRIPGKNVLTKIVALILATVLWLYVTNEQNPSVELSYQIPLEVRNVADDVVVMDAPEVVKIKLRGPRNLMAGIRAQDIKANIDLKGLSEGKHSLQVAFVVPHGLEAVEVFPDKVQLRLDKIITKELPVEIRTIGALPPGLVVTQFKPSIERVTVEGPKSLLDTVSKAFGSVDIKGHDTSFNTEVQLVALASDGKEIEGLSPRPGKVNVAVQLAQGKFKKPVDIKVVTTGEPAKGVVLKGIQLKPEKIEIAGDLQQIEKIEAVITEPINLTNISKDVDKEVKLQLPEGVNVEKNVVTVHISVMKKP